MATSIHDFQGRFKGGVRPNLFSCIVTPPTGFPITNFPFHCKATQLPVSTIGNVDVWYHGRALKVPGDRSYGDWAVTVMNDTNMHIRGVFEDWMHKIQHHHENVQDANVNIYGAANVSQLNRQGQVIRTYKVTSMYPIEIGAIDVSWETNDAIEEYTVTFAINEWTTGRGNTSGTAQGNSAVGVDFHADSNGNIGGSIWGTIGF